MDELAKKLLVQIDEYFLAERYYLILPNLTFLINLLERDIALNQINQQKIIDACVKYLPILDKQTQSYHFREHLHVLVQTLIVKLDPKLTSPLINLLNQQLPSHKDLGNSYKEESCVDWATLIPKEKYNSDTRNLISEYLKQNLKQENDGSLVNMSLKALLTCQMEIIFPYIAVGLVKYLEIGNNDYQSLHNLIDYLLTNTSIIIKQFDPLWRYIHNYYLLLKDYNVVYTEALLSECNDTNLIELLWNSTKRNSPTFQVIALQIASKLLKNCQSHHYELLLKAIIQINSIVISAQSKINYLKYRNYLQKSREIFQEKIDSPIEAQKKFTKKSLKLLKKFYFESLALLGPGNICKVELLILGSSSRSDRLPYSDIELAIIHEKLADKNSETLRYQQQLAYLTRLVQLFELFVIFLNETPDNSNNYQIKDGFRLDTSTHFLGSDLLNESEQILASKIYFPIENDICELINSQSLFSLLNPLSLLNKTSDNQQLFNNYVTDIKKFLATKLTLQQQQKLEQIYLDRMVTVDSNKCFTMQQAAAIYIWLDVLKKSWREIAVSQGKLSPYEEDQLAGQYNIKKIFYRPLAYLGLCLRLYFHDEWEVADDENHPCDLLKIAGQKHLLTNSVLNFWQAALKEILKFRIKLHCDNQKQQEMILIDQLDQKERLTLDIVETCIINPVLTALINQLSNRQEVFNWNSLFDNILPAYLSQYEGWKLAWEQAGQASEHPLLSLFDFELSFKYQDSFLAIQNQNAILQQLYTKYNNTLTQKISTSFIEQVSRTELLAQQEILDNKNILLRDIDAFDKKIIAIINESSCQLKLDELVQANINSSTLTVEENILLKKLSALVGKDLFSKSSKALINELQSYNPYQLKFEELSAYFLSTNSMKAFDSKLIQLAFAIAYYTLPQQYKLEKAIALKIIANSYITNKKINSPLALYYYESAYEILVSVNDLKLTDAKQEIIIGINKHLHISKFKIVEHVLHLFEWLAKYNLVVSLEKFALVNLLEKFQKFYDKSTTENVKKSLITCLQKFLGSGGAALIIRELNELGSENNQYKFYSKLLKLTEIPFYLENNSLPKISELKDLAKTWHNICKRPYLEVNMLKLAHYYVAPTNLGIQPIPQAAALLLSIINTETLKHPLIVTLLNHLIILHINPQSRYYDVDKALLFAIKRSLLLSDQDADLALTEVLDKIGDPSSARQAKLLWQEYFSTNGFTDTTKVLTELAEFYCSDNSFYHKEITTLLCDKLANKSSLSNKSVLIAKKLYQKGGLLIKMNLQQALHYLQQHIIVCQNKSLISKLAQEIHQIYRSKKFDLPYPKILNDTLTKISFLNPVSDIAEYTNHQTILKSIWYPKLPNPAELREINIRITKLSINLIAWHDQFVNKELQIDLKEFSQQQLQLAKDALNSSLTGLEKLTLILGYRLHSPTHIQPRRLSTDAKLVLTITQKDLARELFITSIAGALGYLDCFINSPNRNKFTQHYAEKINQAYEKIAILNEYILSYAEALGCEIVKKLETNQTQENIAQILASYVPPVDIEAGSIQFSEQTPLLINQSINHLLVEPRKISKPKDENDPNYIRHLINKDDKWLAFRSSHKKVLKASVGIGFSAAFLFGVVGFAIDWTSTNTQRQWVNGTDIVDKSFPGDGIDRKQGYINMMDGTNKGLDAAYNLGTFVNVLTFIVVGSIILALFASYETYQKLRLKPESVGDKPQLFDLPEMDAFDLQIEAVNDTIESNKSQIYHNNHSDVNFSYQAAKAKYAKKFSTTGLSAKIIPTHFVRPSTQLQWKKLFEQIAVNVTSTGISLAQSDAWISSLGIKQVLKEIFNNNVDIIDPDTFSTRSIFSTNLLEAKEAATDFIKHLTGHVGTDNKIHPGLLVEEKLTKPLIAILNKTAAKPHSELETEIIGGSHWTMMVVLPGDPINIFYINSAQPEERLPDFFQTMLTQGNLNEFTTKDTIKLNDQEIELHEEHAQPIPAPFPKARFIDNPPVKPQQKRDGSDCGAWAVYNAAMIVFTQNSKFLRHFENTLRAPAQAIRALFPNLTVDEPLASELKSNPICTNKF